MLKKTEGGIFKRKNVRHVNSEEHKKSEIHFLSKKLSITTVFNFFIA